ncbi:MAG TPA: nitroreductase family deazaflavin-dependent oxidoreductase [Acidimicrobiia bacterium]|nr:nitroreductase family deazaflavin-dependent oxidoreductase [Acidimicrobiia bacterium]
MPDFNQQIIDEFHANDGRVGGMFDGATLLLLHHRGAKTGTERVSPLAYRALDGGYAIFASKGGAPTNPAWFHNLVAHPETTVEVGTETVPVRARVAGPEERASIWAAQKELVPQFAEYEQKTTRQIPVVVLERT